MSSLMTLARALIPFRRTPPSLPHLTLNTSQELYLLIPSHGDRVSTYTFGEGGDTSISSTTVAFHSLLHILKHPPATVSDSSGGQQRGERQEKSKVDSALSIADCSLPVGNSNLTLFPDEKEAPLAEFLEYLRYPHRPA